ncbi:hypothetical protein ASE01_00650 [Nocardioides sp. Root190]|uniref:divisome protein SepX/GlpR n=1 Tax=Nocardioides sp. Root190 TaxID=1736488 RepID=UPI0006FE694A|nr:hypothetical protein [Nocardioides sp. Root190]KRB80052.1 hypothetical protein ASE01_00650 [Nocardioides sp. Root190]
MDLSALIFVALAVAWAVYLVPKALKYHEEDDVNRSVDGFSDRLRVLARREAVSKTEAEFVPAGRTAPAVSLEKKESAAPTPAPRAPRSAAAPAPAPAAGPVTPDAEERRRRRARQAAARRAAEKRRRVFNLLLLAIVVVAALVIGKVVAAAWIAVPAGVMVAWLVACRLMVKRERAVRSADVRKRRRTLADEVIEAEDSDVAEDRAEESDEDVRDNTEEIPVITAEVLGDEVVADGWTPVPVPLPTYVAKAPAGRTVRTIDLDSTGVWSSGRNEADSQLAREADAQRAQTDAQSDAQSDERRASGS